MPIPAGGDAAVGSGNLYADLPQLKAWLTGITDTDRDVPLVLALSAASRWIDGYCGRRFYLDDTPTSRTYNLRDRILGDTIIIDDIGVAAGLVVETGTTSGGFTAVTGYDPIPENATDHGLPIGALYNPAGWSYYTTQTVRITARWGWPAVPAAVTQAAVIQAARLFKRKDSPEGVLGGSDWGAVRVGRIDPDVAALLAEYRFARVA